jgi:prepilin peptidase CpaA
MSPLEATCDASLLLLALYAAWSDARTGLIPNVATLSMLAIGPLAHLALGGPGGFLASLGAALGCAFVPLLLFRVGAMGGGDVKLFAAIGALVGLHAGIEIQLFGYMIGAAFALFSAARSGALVRTLRRACSLLARPFTRSSQRSEPDAEPRTQRLGVPVLLSCLWVVGARWLAQGALT